jgi:hypothetical protein
LIQETIVPAATIVPGTLPQSRIVSVPNLRAPRWQMDRKRLVQISKYRKSDIFVLLDQSRNNSLIEVFERVRASTVLMMTPQ